MAEDIHKPDSSVFSLWTPDTHNGQLNGLHNLNKKVQKITNLLAARELELGSAESFNHMFLVVGLGAHRHDDLSDAHASHGPQGLPEGTTHPSLEPTQEYSQ